MRLGHVTIEILWLFIYNYLIYQCFQVATGFQDLQHFFISSAVYEDIWIIIRHAKSIDCFYGFKNPNNVRIWLGGWVTAKWVFGFKNPLVKKIQDQRIILLWMFGSLGGWVTTNPNIVRIFKSLEINGCSLNDIWELLLKVFRPSDL